MPTDSPLILLTEPLLPFTPNRTVTNNASDLHVTSNTVLGPGNYRDVTMDNGVTLTLGAGAYNIRNFHAGKHDTIIVGNGTILNVDGPFDLNDDTDFGSSANPYAQINAGSFGVGSNNATINFGQGDTVYGQFFSPNGQLSLGRQTDAYGRYWGNTINTDFNENITFMAPPPPRSPDSVPVPEPSTGLTGLIGMAALAWATRRRQAAKSGRGPQPADKPVSVVGAQQCRRRPTPSRKRPRL